MVFGKKNTKSEATDDDNHASYQSFSEIASPALNRLFSSRSVDEADGPTETTNADRNKQCADPLASSSNDDFRGFSTSISDLFADAQHERVDCCAITCCGILQHDRDRFLVTGVPPPRLSKRLVLHLVIPCILFVAAGLAAMRIPNQLVNQVASTGLVLLLVFYFCLQCGKGRAKRMEVRKDLLFTKYQLAQRHLLLSINSSPRQRQRILAHERTAVGEDGTTSDNSDDDHEYLLGQTPSDIRCAHPYCLVGCYSEDRRRGQRTRREDSLSANTYELCCPDFCGRHLQIAGLCAIAQEAREIEMSILPGPYRRIDYITMQSIAQYYPAIYSHRHQQKIMEEGGASNSVEAGGEKKKQPTILGHPLSRLSNYILQAFKLFLGIMFTWAIIGPVYWNRIIGRRGVMTAFQIQHFIVMLLTFVQSFGYIAVAKYLVSRHKDPELSMDAIIKYFASGFFLSASLAIFWEFITSQLIDVFISLLLAGIGVVSIDNPETDMMAPTSDLLQSMHSYFGCGFSIGRPEYAVVFGYDHPILYTIYLFLMTFFVAALIEELCKYFGFRMVEHPDFLSRKELHDASVVVQKMDGSHEDVDEQALNKASNMKFSKQLQSVEAQGAAITLAMVTVAIGFACSENLLYVFFYSSRSFFHEVGILIERSFFPVHPVLAAIQSIGVCSRFLENDKSSKLGTIIKSSVLLHGTFDFLIVFINFVANLIGQQYQDGDLKVSNATEFTSLLLCILVLIWSILQLISESKQQRQRLIAIDQSSASSDRVMFL